MPAPLTKREPAVIVGAISSLLVAGIAVAVAFGLDLTKEQVAALTALAAPATLLPIVQAFVTRAAVVSPATADARVEAAVADATAAPELPAARRVLVDEADSPVVA